MNFIFKAQIQKNLLAFFTFVIYSTGWMCLKIGIEPGRGFFRSLLHNYYEPANLYNICACAQM